MAREIRLTVLAPPARGEAGGDHLLLHSDEFSLQQQNRKPIKYTKTGGIISYTKRDALFCIIISIVKIFIYTSLIFYITLGISFQYHIQSPNVYTDTCI